MSRLNRGASWRFPGLYENLAKKTMQLLEENAFNDKHWAAIAVVSEWALEVHMGSLYNLTLLSGAISRCPDFDWEDWLHEIEQWRKKWIMETWNQWMDALVDDHDYTAMHALERITDVNKIFAVDYNGEYNSDLLHFDYSEMLANGLMFKLEIDYEYTEFCAPHTLNEHMKCETSVFPLKKMNSYTAKQTYADIKSENFVSIEYGMNAAGVYGALNTEDPRIFEIYNVGQVGVKGFTNPEGGYALYTYVSSVLTGGGVTATMINHDAYDFEACAFNLDPCREKSIYIGTAGIGLSYDVLFEEVSSSGSYTYHGNGEGSSFIWLMMDYWYLNNVLNIGYDFHDFALNNRSERCVDETLHPSRNESYSVFSVDCHILLLHEPNTGECYIKLD